MSRLGADTVANLAAFGVMAASGVALNLAVLALSGEVALGVFNQVYAGYVIASMIAAFGVHDAVHRDVAAHAGDRSRQAASLGAGLRLVAITGALGALAVFALSGPAGQLVDSVEVGRGLALVAPALFGFAVNKVLMAALAGQTRLQAFAGVQIIRVLTLVAVVVGLAAADAAPGTLALGFGAAELAILPLLLGLLRPVVLGGTAADVRAHLAFGARALPHGLVQESFLRVDVLMLAPLVGDAAIGVYSLAAMFGEGLVQIGGTVRGVVGPRLVPTLVPEGDAVLRRRLLRQAMGLGFGAFVVVGTVLAGGFSWLGLALDPHVVAQAHDVLLVLMAGLAVNAAFLPLDQVPLWAGRPGHQSAMMVLNLGLNVALNAALIPGLGIAGAALATSLAWGTSALVLNVTVAASLRYSGGLVGEAWLTPRARPGSRG